jgi:hypothetical protein
MMDFMQRLPRQRACLEHLNDWVTVCTNPSRSCRAGAAVRRNHGRRALAQTEKEKRAAGLRQAQSIFERLVDIGNNKDDVHSLGSLAFFRAGFGGEVLGGKGAARTNWRCETSNVHGANSNSSDTRPTCDSTRKNVIALWGALLLGSQPKEIVTAKVAESSAAANEKPGLQAAREFLAAVRIFSPAAQPRSLSDTRLSRCRPEDRVRLNVERGGPDERQPA